MIHFGFIEANGQVDMCVLEGDDPTAVRTAAVDALRDHPAATTAHIFDGDCFVESIDAPAFGFTGVNAAEAVPAPELSTVPKTRTSRQATDRKTATH